MYILPLEIFYEIYLFISTCKDIVNFKKTCRLFYQAFPKLCKCDQDEEPIRRLWKECFYGKRVTNTPLPHHRCKKSKITTPLLLNEENTNTYCVVGKSKKLFRFVLNVIAQRNHVGGAIFDTHPILSPILDSYAPKQCFFEGDQLIQCQENIFNFITKIRTISREGEKHNLLRSLIIYFNISNKKHDSYKLFTISRHTFNDELYQ